MHMHVLYTIYQPKCAEHESLLLKILYHSINFEWLPGKKENTNALFMLSDVYLQRY